MGTVGIAFGSPTSGQGFDVSTTVSQLVANLQAVETPWKTQLTSLQSDDTALTSIGTDLGSLSTALQSLTDFEGVLSEKEGSSSDESVLELTSAASNAVAGLASAINAANIGVTASVTTAGGTATLSLANSASGSTGAISVDSTGLTDTTNGTTVSFTSAQSNAVTSFTQLGISTNDDGTLSLDTDTLDSLLNTNYQDVANFFQPSAYFTSFGGNLSNVVNNLGNNAPDGTIYLTLQQDAAEESSLNTNITNENTQISAEQTQLTTELNAANYTLEQIPTAIAQVNEIYSAITGYDENPNG
jgi:flagellar hook-associated protein 2